MGKPSRAERKRARRAAKVALEGLSQAVTLLSAIADDAGAPGWVGIASNSVSAIIKMVQQARSNISDVEDLTTRVQALTAELQPWTTSAKMPMKVQEKIGGLLSRWENICQQAVDMRSRNACLRLVRGSLDSQEIAQLIKQFGDSMMEFTFQGVIDIQAGVTRVEDRMDRVQEQLEDIRTLEGLTLLPIAPRARYDSSLERNECLEDTRTEILEGIKAWADQSLSTASLPPDVGVSSTHQIFWLNGLAGTGKTTIAYTIARWCDRGNPRGTRLGASFFCSRSDADCNDASRIFTTIAYQLAEFFPPYGKALSDVIRATRSVLHAAAPHHFEDLIVKPLQALLPHASFPPCLIVLDAPDECLDSKITSAVLSMLLRHISTLPPIRILVTSRPEPHIAVPFNAQAYLHVAGRLPLHKVELSRVNRDIKHFIKTSLVRAHEEFAVPPWWPDDEDVDRLTDRSKGLFVYAKTEVRYILDERYSDPTGQLAVLLASSSSSALSLLEQLHDLYRQVLVSALSNTSKDLARRLRTVLACIILAKEPLTVRTVAALFDWTVEHVLNSLRLFHSVLSIPQSNEIDSKTVELVHPTFPDFMLNPDYFGEHPKTLPLAINAEEANAMFSDRCFDAMVLLRRDICDIRDISILLTEIPDLAQRIARHLPLHVRYACRHWPAHVSQAHLTDQLLGRIREFLQTRMLYWIEVCSLIGVLRDALVGLNTCRLRLAGFRDDIKDIVELLDDGQRFIIAFFPSISASSLQLYYSALPFAPRDTALARAYSHELQSSCRVIHGIPRTWSPCIGAVVGHGGRPTSAVQFAPDGATFASAGYDNTVAIWDATTCTLRLTLEGHTDVVESASYSRDGAYIVSASHNGTVRVWDAGSGVPVKQLEGCNKWISSAVFIANDKYIISASASLQIWDVLTGNCILTLERRHDSLVTVSPDGCWIASGDTASNATEPACIWDIMNYSPRVLPTTPGAQALAFTPDSLHLIVRLTNQQGLHVWDVRSLTCVWRISNDAFHPRMNCLAIAPDGLTLACPSDDDDVLLIDVRDGSLRRRLPGNTGHITSLAFNSDGTRLVSSASPGSIRLWDTGLGVSDDLVPLAESTVATVVSWGGAAFSEAGTLTSVDKTGVIEIHNPSTQQSWRHIPDSPPVPNSKYVEVFSSPDSCTTVAYHQSGSTVLINLISVKTSDAVEGSVVVQIEEPRSAGYRRYSPSSNMFTHWNGVLGYRMHRFGSFPSSMVFSEDSKYFARVSSQSITLHDTTLHRDVVVFEGHTSDVLRVAFSLDGTLLASGGDDTTVRLWDTRMEHTHALEPSPPKRSCIWTFEGHPRGVTAVAFSPDGRRIASGCDQAIRLWVTDTGECVSVIPMDASERASALAFSPDGATLFSCSYLEPVRMWDVSSLDCIAAFYTSTWLDTLLLAPDGSGIVIEHNNTQRTIRLWHTGADSNPDAATSKDLWRPRRTWPFCYMDSDRWIFSLSPGKKPGRLCRIPDDWGALMTHSGSLLGFQGGQVVDVSALIP